MRLETRERLETLAAAWRREAANRLRLIVALPLKAERAPAARSAR